MALGLYELINNINKQIKSICCKVNALLDSGAGSYKVYTALLTQSGGDNLTSINSGELTIGVTYLINGSAILDGCDFTNVGAPNNVQGTYFVATGTTPNWGNTVNPDMLYYNTGAPVVTVLENTIGNIWFTYNGVGDYSINSSGLFTDNKTVQFINSPLGLDEGILLVSNNNASNLIYLTSTNSNPDRVDGFFNDTPIEIRVYN